MNSLPLNHKRIAIAGGKCFVELENIINNLGGEALFRPVMSSSTNDCKDTDDAVKHPAKQGASGSEIPFDFYDLPGHKNVRTLLYETLSAEIDVIAFTSNTQVKVFFQGTEALGATSYLQNALQEKVIAFSVDSMTTKVLKEHGVTRIVAPPYERMEAMVMELANYCQQVRLKTSFPVMLTNLQRVVVIGGGKVAERKVRALLEANVKPVIISPDIGRGLETLVQEAELEYQAKPYEAVDLMDADLIIAATSDADINAQIAANAKIKHILCNVADAPELGNITTLGTIRRGDLTIALSTNGLSPSLNSFLAEKFEQQFPDAYAVLLAALGEHRGALAKLEIVETQGVLTQLTKQETLEQLSQFPDTASKLCRDLIYLTSTFG